MLPRLSLFLAILAAGAALALAPSEPATGDVICGHCARLGEEWEECVDGPPSSGGTECCDGGVCGICGVLCRDEPGPCFIEGGCIHPYSCPAPTPDPELAAEPAIPML